MNDLVHQIHNPQNKSGRNFKEGQLYVRLSYSEQKNASAEAGPWLILCQASTAKGTSSFRDISHSGTYWLRQKVLLFSI